MFKTTFAGSFALALSLAACSSNPPPQGTTGGRGTTTGSGAGSTTGSAATQVSTYASLLSAGSCSSAPRWVVTDPSGILYAMTNTLVQVTPDGGTTPVVPGVLGMQAVAISSNGTFVSMNDPIAIYSVMPFSESYVAGGASSTDCADSISGIDGGVGFIKAIALAADTFEHVYVADWGFPGCTKIRQVNVATNTTITYAGSGQQGFKDGDVADAEFNDPSGIAVDTQRNVYVGDTVNNRIRMIDTAGNVTTLAGNGTAGFDDGPGLPNTPSSATFNTPTGVAVDSAGTVYVADTGNNAIRMITADAGVQTIAGNGTLGNFDGSLGKGGTSEFNYPTSVAIDKKGNLFVADYGNCAIREIKPPFTGL